MNYVQSSNLNVHGIDNWSMDNSAKDVTHEINKVVYGQGSDTIIVCSRRKVVYGQL